MKRLVLDLRNNGGGLLDQAIEVADQFLPGREQDRRDARPHPQLVQTYSSTGKYAELGLPVVVLVNGGTASASEILSGAIQDHDVGLVVGEPSWGKGLVQTVYNLPYGAGLALTTAKYYTPSGRLIQRDYSSYCDYYADYGHDDDVEVEGEDAAEDRRDREEARRGLHHRPRPQGLRRRRHHPGRRRPSSTPQPDFLQFLRARDAFLNFAVDYLRDAPVTSKDWQPDDAVFDKLVTWLKQESIGTPRRDRRGVRRRRDPPPRDARDPLRGLQRRLRRDRGSPGPQQRRRPAPEGDQPVRRSARAARDPRGDQVHQEGRPGRCRRQPAPEVWLDP